MRNGTHSNRLTLIHSGQGAGSAEADDDAAAYYPYTVEGDAGSPSPARHAEATFIVFVAVSVACMTAAIATGSYAAWLARQHAARQALTDVSDILKSCQERMQQLESQVERLPSRLI